MESDRLNQYTSGNNQPDIDSNWYANIKVLLVRRNLQDGRYDSTRFWLLGKGKPEWEAYSFFVSNCVTIDKN